ncbi:Nif11-like leader peptide family natural product precursor [Streptomyces diastatochromogenes]|uniref:Nif11-like leader peptide family natural product precursor n=1 Tax=Streptomyces diastatochromogenes TaxID=42236 RepID=UPI003661C649
MSQQSFVKFLLAARDDPAKRAAYESRNLSQLVFHAKNEGFEFTPEEMAEVVSQLEMGVIIEKDAEPVDGNSSLWRAMWGQTHLGYLLDRVVARHTDDELRTLAETNGAALQ